MSSSDEKLCLKWNNFQANVSSAFGERREDGEFADVTLACEDGQQVETHKVILASASPFFRNLLRKNKHPHPLVYMSGLKYEDLTAIVNFLYLGEAKVSQGSLDTFLVMAEELKIKGFTSNPQTEDEETEVPPQKEDQLSVIKTEQSVIQTMQTVTTETNEVAQAVEADVEGVVDFNESSSDQQDLDELIKSMIDVSSNILGGARRNMKARTCKVCGKEGENRDIKRHIEAKHITGVFHGCPICKKSFRSGSYLKKHMRRNH